MTEKKIAIVKNESIGKIALEMGLHRWLLISQYAEEKNVRVNLVKLGCLFEAFLGALFLDFNKMPVADTGRLFENVFLIGTGFQMAHLFIEHVFAGHIDWTRLIQTDDNYKNILQVKIQKEFKVTPYYMEIVHDGVKTTEHGFRMGVYLCLNQSSYLKSHADATHVRNYGATPAEILEKLHQYFVSGAGLFVFLGEGTHKIKRKAEQQACFQALQRISTEPIYNT